MTFETSHNVHPAEVHFSFLHIDLRILLLDRRNDRRVFRLSAGPGQGISRVRSILNWVAVSYTHLDVYKRQGWLISCRFTFL